MIKMDKNEPALVSGRVEYIVIKPESIELLFDEEEEPFEEEDESINSGEEFFDDNIDECCFVISSGEVIRLNNKDVIKTPFYLESYFLDNDRFRSKAPDVPVQYVIEVDRVTCFKCDIVFCNEHRLLEHLMTHIDIDKMGCDICDKDLNSEEKFHLHTMAVTWQSVYYCDFCRKSCAGVVRSKSQPPPPGKIYMCHDCELLVNQRTINFQNNGLLCNSGYVKPTLIPQFPLSSLTPIQSFSLPQLIQPVQLQTTKHIPILPRPPPISLQPLLLPQPLQQPQLLQPRLLQFSTTQQSQTIQPLVQSLQPPPPSQPTQQPLTLQPIIQLLQPLPLSTQQPKTVQSLPPPPPQQSQIVQPPVLQSFEPLPSSVKLAQSLQPPQNQPSQPPTTVTEVLQDHKQKSTNETKHDNFLPENSTSEVQDCRKSRKPTTKKKENKKCRRIKPKIKVVSESKKQTLKMTTRSRTREKQTIRFYQCRFCPDSFTDDHSMMQHLKEEHNFHKLRYICKFCGKEFSQQHSYDNHASIHQVAKNHMCFLCNLAFLTKSELEQHARFHKESEFANTICDDTNNVALDLRKKSTKSST